MTYCTFLERQHLYRLDDGNIGHTNSSVATYDTATYNPRHRSSVNTLASYSTRGGSKGSSTRTIGGEGIDSYRNDRKRDDEVNKKAYKMAKRAVGKPNYYKARKDDKEFDKAERFETAADAARRHVRRHPQSESAGIFGNIDII